jgi:hypothetical protein
MIKIYCVRISNVYNFILSLYLKQIGMSSTKKIHCLFNEGGVEVVLLCSYQKCVGHEFFSLIYIVARECIVLVLHVLIGLYGDNKLLKLQIECSFLLIYKSLLFVYVLV